jgi:alpha-mannosidase
MSDATKGRSAALIPYDVPLVNFGDIVRGNWPEDFHPRSGSIFSWLMSNYWGTNFPSSQGGDFSFRYSVVSGPTTDPAQLTRLGWDLMTPLEADPVGASDGTSNLPSNAASLLYADNSNVVVTTWKLAEDSDGSIVRLEEIAGKTATVSIKSDFLRVEKAWRCNALEERETPLSALDGGTKIELKPFEIATIRIQTAPLHSGK